MMKKKSTIILFLLFYYFGLNAQTSITDKSEVSGLWTKANSPYIINGLAIIPEGDTLAIEPGVIVKLKTGENNDFNSENFDVGILKVLGNLNCKGTQSDSIVFTREGQDGYWGSILFLNQTSIVNIEYCIFEFGSGVENIVSGGYSNSSFGALSFYRSNSSVQNSSFRQNNNRGLSIVMESSCKVQNNIFHDNNIGAEIYMGEFGLDSTSNNLFYRNWAGIRVSSTGKLINNQFYENSHAGIISLYKTSIEANLIYNNENGIYGKGDNGSTVVGNKIYQNNYGVYYSGDGWGSISLINNLIFENENGIYLKKIGGNIIFNNTIANNKIIGLSLIDCFNTSLKNNIHWNNNSEFEFNIGFDIQNSSIPSLNLPAGVNDLGENLFETYPSFSDTLNRNYSLKEISQCINAGYVDTTGLFLPQKDLAGNPRFKNGRIDIGAYEYQKEGNYMYLVNPNNQPYIVSNYNYLINWHTSNPAHGTDILLSIDNGKNWSEIETSNFNEEYSWKTPELISDSCLLLVRNSSNYSIADTSKVSFRISPNYIPDGFNVFQPWKKIYSPYKVFGLIEVPSDSTLIIEPGVEIQFKEETAPSNNIYKNGGAMYLNGKILANGTESEKITFTSIEKDKYWGSIEINSFSYGDTSIFRNCIFEYGGHGRDGAVELQYGTIFSQNTLRKNWNCGLHIEGHYRDNPISNCIFYENNLGVSVYTLSGDEVILNNCTFYNNTNGIESKGYKCLVNNSIFSSNINDFAKNWQSPEYKANYCFFDNENTPNLTENLNPIFNKNPKFFNVKNYDFHLRQNSPCIDAGTILDDFSNEPEPNGDRINIGAYGNTKEATLSPLFTVSEIDISTMGHDTITLYKNNLGTTRGDGSIKLGSYFAEIISWNDDSLQFVTLPSNSGSLSLSLTLTDSVGNSFVVNNFIDCHEPTISNVNPFYGLTAGGDNISIRGSYFGNVQQRLLIDSSIYEINSWSDTLIQATTLSHSAGKVDFIFETNDNNFRFINYDSFLFLDEDPINLCDDYINTLKSGKTYILSCILEIPTYSTLTIEEGVTIYINGNIDDVNPAIIANGKLVANGTEMKPIIITSVQSSFGDWSGIELNYPSEIRFTHISNAVNGIDIRCADSEIDNCIISNSSENGIKLNGSIFIASATIKNNQIFNNQNYGINILAHANEFIGKATGIIEKNSISHNSLGGIYVKATGSVPWSTTNASASAIAAPSIKNNKIFENEGSGLYCYSNGERESAIQGGSITRGGVSTPLIQQNTIYNNSEGIKLYQGYEYAKTEAIATNNVIYNNGIEINGGLLNFYNGILWGDNSDIVSTTGIFKPEYSLLSSPSSVDSNISDNPLFESPETGDFQLLPNSPCIDAGSNDFVETDTDFAGKIRIINNTVDIGVYESNSYYVGIIKQEISGSRLNVYPNPTNGIVQLEGLPNGENVIVSIYNLSGKIVSQFENTGSKAIIDIRKESPGIYLIKIDGKTRHTAKIIKK